jgi:hypothetical protein
MELAMLSPQASRSESFSIHPIEHNDPSLVIGKSRPSLNHSYLCLKILEILLQNNKILPLPELTLGIANGITPDISVFWKQTIQPNFFQDVARFPERPILADLTQSE